MATKVYDVVEIELQDGTKLELRPLKIKLLREFMKRFTSATLDEDTDNEDSVDLLIDCVQISMKQFKPELAEDRDALEDVLDMPTIYKIIEVASGIKLNDPNLMAAAGLSGTT